MWASRGDAQLAPHLGHTDEPVWMCLRVRPMAEGRAAKNVGLPRTGPAL